MLFSLLTTKFFQIQLIEEETTSTRSKLTYPWVSLRPVRHIIGSFLPYRTKSIFKHWQTLSMNSDFTHKFVWFLLLLEKYKDFQTSWTLLHVMTFIESNNLVIDKSEYDIFSGIIKQQKIHLHKIHVVKHFLEYIYTSMHMWWIFFKQHL